MAAQPGSKAYGRLTVMLQYHCAVDHLFDVPPEAFDPQPKVDSAVVRLIPHRESPFRKSVCSAVGTFGGVCLFDAPTKTLNNNLEKG